MVIRNYTARDETTCDVRVLFSSGRETGIRTVQIGLTKEGTDRRIISHKRQTGVYVDPARGCDMYFFVPQRRREKKKKKKSAGKA